MNRIITINLDHSNIDVVNKVIKMFMLFSDTPLQQIFLELDKVPKAIDLLLSFDSQNSFSFIDLNELGITLYCVSKYSSNSTNFFSAFSDGLIFIPYSNIISVQSENYNHEYFVDQIIKQNEQPKKNGGVWC